MLVDKTEFTVHATKWNKLNACHTRTDVEFSQMGRIGRILEIIVCLSHACCVNVSIDFIYMRYQYMMTMTTTTMPMTCTSHSIRTIVRTRWIWIKSLYAFFFKFMFIYECVICNAFTKLLPQIHAGTLKYIRTHFPKQHSTNFDLSLIDVIAWCSGIDASGKRYLLQNKVFFCCCLFYKL